MEKIEELVREGGISSVYQPIVDLQTNDVIAYEALARGPKDSPFARPDLMFSAARREGLLGELDWECRVSALRGALESGMLNPTVLFINLEPEALETPVPPRHAELIARAPQELRLIGEITERSLASRPAGLLRTVQSIRELGAGIAIDDVGADDRSLGLLPFIRPDVVKLDLRLVQERTTTDIASVSNAVSAHTERTGGRVLAEGIETAEHLKTALALGATLGQGWFFGRPEPLPAELPFVKPWAALPLLGSTTPILESHTPFEILHGERQILEADEGILLSMSRHLERRAEELGPRGVVLAGLQEAKRVTPRTKWRYERLASTGALVGIVAEGVNNLALNGIARGDLASRDRLRREWAVTVVGPHFSAGLAARELDGTEGRSFAFALTHNRELVVRMAASLLFRLQEGDDAQG